MFLISISNTNYKKWKGLVEYDGRGACPIGCLEGQSYFRMLAHSWNMTHLKSIRKIHGFLTLLLMLLLFVNFMVDIVTLNQRKIKIIVDIVTKS